MHQNQVLKVFDGVKIDSTWAFADTKTRDTNYITHGYHRYPAKFIPQVVARLIEEYTNEGDLVGDPFGGCGTTLIESKIMQRPSVGVDINPVAHLLTSAKIESIKPEVIEKAFLQLQESMEKFNGSTKATPPQHERIDYWFRPDEKKKLAFLFAEIDKIKNKKLKNFFFCGFSNILKNCSIWHQNSNKPLRDYSKTPDDPFVAFPRQIKKMMRGNADFFEIVNGNKTPCKVHCKDARKFPAEPNSVSLIVTSPPYVTSYEYADLHQLTAIWFEYAESISSFRKRFIGTAQHEAKKIFLNSKIAESIRAGLESKHKKTSVEVATYFSEMNQVFEKMHRVLKKDGKIAVVIGNTSLKGQAILNAEVFAEQMLNIGFDIEDVIEREIPSKTLPSVRDKETGKFAKNSSDKKIFVYPTEYIVVMRKL